VICIRYDRNRSLSETFIVFARLKRILRLPTLNHSAFVFKSDGVINVLLLRTALQPKLLKSIIRWTSNLLLGHAVA
jgi:hypothetical protein